MQHEGTSLIFELNGFAQTIWCAFPLECIGDSVTVFGNKASLFIIENLDSKCELPFAERKVPLRCAVLGVTIWQMFYQDFAVFFVVFSM